MEENKEKPEVMEEVNSLVERAQVALEEFTKYTQEDIDFIVAKCSVAGLDAHGTLAQAAIDETKRGVFEDKATKNLFACEYVVNNMRHLKTVGVISEDPVTGITEIAEPVGVICGIIIGVGCIIQQSTNVRTTVKTGLTSMNMVFQPIAVVLLAQIMERKINIIIIAQIDHYF